MAAPITIPPGIEGAPSSTCLTESLHQVCDGRELSAGMAHDLLRCDDNVLHELLAAARSIKERFHPAVITYSRKVFIPLTNLCRDYCGYCTYRRDPGEPGAHTMTPDEVLAVAQQGEKLGCTEALFSLGDRPETLFPEMRDTLRHLGYRSTLHYLEAMCELVLRETRLLPHANPGLLSANWIERLRDKQSQPRPDAGEHQHALLGARSRRMTMRRTKLPALRLKTIEDAGKLGVPFTTGILIGIGETMEDRVDSLLAIKRLHEQYGHIQEVIIQNFRVKPRIPMAAWPEPDTGDMLRTLAVARLLLRDMNIQAPPNLTENGYERLLEAGINDWGGVSPLTPDYINPEAPWPHLLDLQRRTEAAGQKLMQRLPVYPEFVRWRSGARWVAGRAVEGRGRCRRLCEASVDDRRLHGRNRRHQAGAGLAAGGCAEELTVIVNTGDDIEWWGLHVSPDIDSVLYGLAGLLSKDRGWGVDDDSFRCLERMKQLGQPSWFSLGDLDLATHLTRTAMLRAGKSLSEATAELAAKLGIRARVLPMSDDRVSTMLDTAKGTLTFQEYFVRERHQVEVHAVRFEGAEQRAPRPVCIESIAAAEAIIFAPSNPVTSIGPILAVPGIREALAADASARLRR